MSGRGIGAALQGYERGRRNLQSRTDWKEDREWRRKRRERQETEEAWSDPMKKRRATRTDEYEEFEDPLKRAGATRRDTAEGREEDYQTFADPARRRNLERRDRSGARIEEYEVYNEPSKYRAADRADRAGGRAEEREIFDEPYRQRGLERGDRAGDRQEEREIYDEPSRRRGVDRGDAAGARQEEYGEGDINQYRREEGSREFSDQSNRATTIFDQTGNPQPLEDFYNDIYPDDGEISIEKNQDGTYTATYGDGTVVENQTKEDVLAGSIKFFGEAPQMADLATGYGGGGYRSGVGGRARFAGGTRGGRGGRGGAAAGGTWEGKINRTINDLVEYGGMPVREAVMEAHARASQSSNTPPREAISGFYEKMVTSLQKSMGDMSMLDPEEQEQKMQRVRDLADTMTDEFAAKYFGGEQQEEAGREQPGEEDGGNDYLQDLIDNSL